MTELGVPSNPCSSCPYRCDTPPGVWHPDEYRRLPAYDETPGPLGVFLCHHQNGNVCRGWLAVHPDGIATRIALAEGTLPARNSWPACTVEVYLSSTAAAEAGLVDGPAPPEAAAVIARLTQRQETRP